MSYKFNLYFFLFFLFLSIGKCHELLEYVALYKYFFIIIIVIIIIIIIIIIINFYVKTMGYMCSSYFKTLILINSSHMNKDSS